MKWKSFFTKVYLINLPEMTDRLAISDAALKEEGIDYELFVATKNDNGVLGLLQTMKNLFTHIIENTEDENVLILEDDFKFLLKPNSFLNLLVEQLPADYDALFLGCNLLSRPTRISENLLRIETSYSTHAIGYSRAAIRKVLAVLDRPTSYDILLMKYLQPDQKCYTTYPMLATQLPGFSSIEQRDIHWNEYLAQSYMTYTKGI